MRRRVLRWPALDGFGISRPPPPPNLTPWLQPSRHTQSVNDKPSPGCLLVPTSAFPAAASVMDQLDPDTGLETSSPVQELVEAIRLHKFTLKNLEHALNRVSHKADTLAGSNVVHAPEFTDPFLPVSAVTTDMLRPSVDLIPNQPFPIAFDPSQNPAHDNWGLGDEPRRRGMDASQ